MHKNVSFPLIKAWFHCIFQWSWKWGSFICRRRFRGDLASAQDRILFVYMQWVTLLVLQVSTLNHQLELTGAQAAQPSPDAKDRRMWETNRDTHCWEYVETEAHWQGNKATCCTCSTKETKSLCCQPGSSHKLYIWITSSSKSRNQIESPSIFTIYIKSSHI